MADAIVVSLADYRARRGLIRETPPDAALYAVERDLAAAEYALSTARQRRDQHAKGSRGWFRGQQQVVEWVHWCSKLQRDRERILAKEADRG